MIPLPCQRCGAALPLPEDLAALSVTCPYCGTTSLLPEAALRARRTELEARRADAERARAAQEHAAHVASTQRGVRLTVALSFAGALVAVLAGVGFTIWQLRRGPSAGSPRERAPSGEAELAARVKELDGLGCKHVVITPTTHEHPVTLTLDMPQGNCAKVLARTGAKEPLALVLKTPLGASSSPPAATALELDVCADKEGKHTVEVTPGAGDPFSAAVVECPVAVVRFGGKPPPDADGAKKVSARLKELDALGCKRVFSAPEQRRRSVGATWTIAAPACYVFLAANGIGEKLTLSAKTPLGEELAAPAPGPSLELRTCIDRVGEYKLRVDAATQEPFTTATIECPAKVVERLGGVVRAR